MQTPPLQNTQLEIAFCKSISGNHTIGRYQYKLPTSSSFCGPHIKTQIGPSRLNSLHKDLPSIPVQITSVVPHLGSPNKRMGTAALL